MASQSIDATIIGGMIQTLVSTLMLAAHDFFTSIGDIGGPLLTVFVLIFFMVLISGIILTILYMILNTLNKARSW